MKKEKVKEILDILEDTYPDAECALNHNNIYELTVAVALSAQTTDKSVNKVTPALFRDYPGPLQMAEAKQKDIEEHLKTIGMYRQKAKNLINMSSMIMEEFDGKVPDNYGDLVKLPGVGRKTANVVLSVGYGVPRIAVDTHVFRVSNRIGLVHETDVLKTEKALMNTIPEDRWSRTHHSLIFHGRNCCKARKPECETCSISRLCEKNLK